MRSDEKAANVREIGGKVFGDAVGQVFLFRIAADISEGQHRDGERWCVGDSEIGQRGLRRPDHSQYRRLELPPPDPGAGNQHR